MIKKYIKHAGIFLVCALALIANAKKIYAQEDYSYVVSNVPYIAEDVTFGAEGLSWKAFLQEEPACGVSYTYEVEIADNPEFSDAKKYTATKQAMELTAKQLGPQAGRYYARVRTCAMLGDGQQLQSDWSEVREFSFVAITKKNFPGLYKLLKNGGKRSTLTGTEPVTYDKNGDGWLEPAEIRDLNSIDSCDEYIKKKRKTVVKKAVDVSSLEGLEYLPNVRSISLARYSGSVLDASKVELFFLNVRQTTAKRLTVIAPTAKHVSVQASIDVKVKSMDVSRCDNAVDLLVYGNKGTKKLKLPKNKTNLKNLSLSDFKLEHLNLNSYTKLQQFYLYHTRVKTVKVKKCKDLRYIYFYFCTKLDKLELKANKKLVGADVYNTPGLTRSTVKSPKRAKVTWKKGKWWYETKKYKQLMKNMYK